MARFCPSYDVSLLSRNRILRHCSDPPSSTYSLPTADMLQCGLSRTRKVSSNQI
jgi:hypothetical protein